MPNPFPGMNPYLEQSDYWSDFHNHLIAALALDLIPLLLPKYRVVTDKWVYKVSGDLAIAIGRPDVTIQQRRTREQLTTTVATSEPQALPIKVAVPLLEEVRQSYIEVKDAATKEVVTAIEILSPANKRGDGRQKYESKRQQVLDSFTHLVEIDLLREGEPLPMLGNTTSHYRILVSRSDTRPTADLYAFDLGDRIPSFELPVRPNDTGPIVNLQKLVNELYEQLGYDYFINYSFPPPPPWSELDVAKWLRDSH